MSRCPDARRCVRAKSSIGPDLSPPMPAVEDIAGKATAMDDKSSPTNLPSSRQRRKRQARRSSSRPARVRSQKAPFVRARHIYTELCPSEKYPDLLYDYPDLPATFKPVPGQTYQLVVPKMELSMVLTQGSDDELSDDGPFLCAREYYMLGKAIKRQKRKGHLYTREEEDEDADDEAE